MPETLAERTPPTPAQNGSEKFLGNFLDIVHPPWRNKWFEPNTTTTPSPDDQYNKTLIPLTTLKLSIHEEENKTKKEINNKKTENINNEESTNKSYAAATNTTPKNDNPAKRDTYDNASHSIYKERHDIITSTSLCKDGPITKALKLMPKEISGNIHFKFHNSDVNKPQAPATISGLDLLAMTEKLETDEVIDTLLKDSNQHTENNNLRLDCSLDTKRTHPKNRYTVMDKQDSNSSPVQAHIQVYMTQKLNDKEYSNIRQQIRNAILESYDITPHAHPNRDGYYTKLYPEITGNLNETITSPPMALPFQVKTEYNGSNVSKQSYITIKALQARTLSDHVKHIQALTLAGSAVIPTPKIFIDNLPQYGSDYELRFDKANADLKVYNKPLNGNNIMFYFTGRADKVGYVTQCLAAATHCLTTTDTKNPMDMKDRRQRLYEMVKNKYPNHHLTDEYDWTTIKPIFFKTEKKEDYQRYTENENTPNLLKTLLDEEAYKAVCVDHKTFKQLNERCVTDMNQSLSLPDIAGYEQNPLTQCNTQDNIPNKLIIEHLLEKECDKKLEITNSMTVLSNERGYVTIQKKQGYIIRIHRQMYK